MPGRVGQQVAQDLNDAPPVRPHRREVRLQVDLEGVPAPSAEEGVPGPVHKAGDLGRFGRDRQRAGPDAGHVEKVADHLAHGVGLIDDDPAELAHLLRIQVGGGLQQRRARAPDGGQGPAQLVAHHTQELRPEPLQILQRRQVLQGHDEGLDLVLPGADRGGIQQHAHGGPVGDPEDDLLDPHCLPGAQRLGQEELAQGNLLAVGPADGDLAQEFLHRPARLVEDSGDPGGLPVVGHQDSGPRVEDQHPHRRSVDEGFQVRPGPLLVPVPAGVGDGRSRLGGEHDQRLLVLFGERPAPPLVAQIEVAQESAPVTDRRAPGRHSWTAGRRSRPGSGREPKRRAAAPGRGEC